MHGGHSIWTRAKHSDGLERPHFWEPLAAQKNHGVAPAPKTWNYSVCEVFCPCPVKARGQDGETRVDQATMQRPKTNPIFGGSEWGIVSRKNVSDCQQQMNTTSFAQARGFDAAPYAPRLC